MPQKAGMVGVWGRKMRPVITRMSSIRKESLRTMGTTIRPWGGRVSIRGIIPTKWQDHEMRTIIGIPRTAVDSMTEKQAFREKAPVERRYFDFYGLGLRGLLPYISSSPTLLRSVCSEHGLSVFSLKAETTDGYGWFLQTSSPRGQFLRMTGSCSNR